MKDWEIKYKNTSLCYRSVVVAGICQKEAIKNNVIDRFDDFVHGIDFENKKMSRESRVL